MATEEEENRGERAESLEDAVATGLRVRGRSQVEEDSLTDEYIKIKSNQEVLVSAIISSTGLIII